MTLKIRVFLVDDHHIVLNGLESLINQSEDLEVVGTASNIASAITLIEELRPDVVVLDYKLPDGNGLDLARKLKEKNPKQAIILLTALSKNQLIKEAVDIGINGYLLKNIAYELLISSIKMVHSGGKVYDPSIDISILNKSGDENLDGLSPREREILEILSQGKSNKEIAVELSISEDTVRNYIANLYKKINVSNRTEAANYWTENHKS